MEKVVVAVVCDRRWFSGMKNPLLGKSTTVVDSRYKRELTIPDKFLPHRRNSPAPQNGKDGENIARVNRISEPPSTGTGDKRNCETRHNLIHVCPIETKSPGA